MAAWLTTELDQVEHLRDDLRLPWAEIAVRFPGRTRSQVTAAYHNRKRQRDRAAERAAAALVVQPPAPVVDVEVALHPQLEGAMRRQSLEVLRDWADLRLRIAERGLTGGILGDPPPGRSALDARTRAAAAGFVRRFDRGGSDVR